MQRAVYTASEAAEIMGCSKGHIYNMVNSGQLSAFRFGPKLIRIPVEAIEAMKCANTVSSNTEESGPSHTEKAERRAACRVVRMTRR